MYSQSTNTDTWKHYRMYIVKINFVLIFFKVVKLKNYFRVNNAQTMEIGTCITYLTNFDTIKNCWHWPNTDTDTRNWCSPNIKYAPQHCHEPVVCS